MFNVGGQEFALIIVLALVVVGPDQLPGLIRKMGHYAAQARQMSTSLRAEFMSVTEPMQDTFKEFQEGMNEFQTGMTDLSKTVTDAADVKQWGTGAANDPIVPHGFSDGQSADGESGDGTDSEKASDGKADTADIPATDQRVADTSGSTAPGAPTPAAPAAAAAAVTGRPDPWADDRIQPITAPDRPKKKLELRAPVNPWADVRDHVDVGGGSVEDQTETAAEQLDSSLDEASAAEPDEESA